MKNRSYISAIFCGLLLAGFCITPALAARKTKNVSHVYVIRPPILPQEKHPLIMGFKVRIKNGVVTPIANLRAAFVVTIANSRAYGNLPDDPTTFEGSVQTSIIAPEEFRDLKFTVERGVDLSPDFQISGVLETVDDDDDSNIKEIQLKPENFQIVK